MRGSCGGGPSGSGESGDVTSSTPAGPPRINMYIDTQTRMHVQACECSDVISIVTFFAGFSCDACEHAYQLSDVSFIRVAVDEPQLWWAHERIDKTFRFLPGGWCGSTTTTIEGLSLSRKSSLQDLRYYFLVSQLSLPGTSRRPYYLLSCRDHVSIYRYLPSISMSLAA